MKLGRVASMVAFGGVAFSSWASPVYGQFDWSWSMAVPETLEAGVSVVQSGVRSFLGEIDNFYSAANDAQEWPSYCPDSAGDGIAANPTLVTRAQVGELIDRKPTGLNYPQVKRIIGEPLCFIEERQLRWIGEGDILLDVTFTSDWRMSEGLVHDIPE